jgi:hypothetical protein
MSRTIFSAFPIGSGQPLALCTTATVLPILITYSFCFQLFVNLLTFFVFRAEFAIVFPDSYRVFIFLFVELYFIFIKLYGFKKSDYICTRKYSFK